MSRIFILLPVLVVLSAAPLSAAGRAPKPASANSRPLQRIAFLLESEDFQRGRIVTVRADGRGGVRQLVPGTHNHNFCRSADGRKMAYFSDEEAPHEQFVYVANSDGAHAEKITEESVGFWCPFSRRWLLLTGRTWGWGAMTIVRHDLQTGTERTIVRGADRLSLSPDGSKLVFVGGLDFTPQPDLAHPKGKETLELLDLTTLARRRLAGPLARGRSYRFFHPFSAPGWSPDRRRFAYTVGPSYYPRRVGRTRKRPPAQPYAVYVQPVSGAAARLVLRFSGGPPSISWSADSRRLLVCAQNRPRPFLAIDFGCNGDVRVSTFAGKLLLVDLAHRLVRRVASGKLLFAQWAPSGTTYAYATTAAAYVARSSGPRRLLASAPKPDWPAGAWMGWSPNGRYIGLGGFSARLAVLDTATRQIRVLLRDRNAGLIGNPMWWA